MNVCLTLGELKSVILCVALFLMESALKWLRQQHYPFLDALWSLQGLRIKKKKDAGRRQKRRKEEREREEATEKNERMGEGTE